MTKLGMTKKTFSMPTHIADRLDEAARHIGFSQSNMVVQALANYFYRFERDGSLERWLEMNGKMKGGARPTED